MRQLLHSPLDDLCSALRGDGIGGASPEEIIWLANSHLVSPALFTSLKKAGHPDFGDDLMEYLEEIHRLNCARNQRLRMQASELASELNKVGITPTFIKGARFLFLHEDETSCDRMLSDLDVVVEEEAAQTAVSALGRIGYDLLQKDADGKHTVGAFSRTKDVGSVDLHVRYPGPPKIADDLRSRGRLERRTVEGATIFLPDRALAVVITIIHEMLHDHHLRTGGIAVRYLMDLEFLLTRAAREDHERIQELLAGFTPRLSLAVQQLMLKRMFVHKNTLVRVGPLAQLHHWRRLLLSRSAALAQIDKRARRIAGAVRNGLASAVAKYRIAD